SAIHINMPNAASLKLRNDFGRGPRHMLHHSTLRGGSERLSAEHENRLLTIRPGVKSQDRLEGLATHDQRIHRGHELFVAVGFAATLRQEIELTIDSSDKAVEAGANKDRCFHCKLLLLLPDDQQRQGHA